MSDIVLCTTYSEYILYFFNNERQKLSFTELNKKDNSWLGNNQTICISSYFEFNNSTLVSFSNKTPKPPRCLCDYNRSI